MPGTSKGTPEEFCNSCRKPRSALKNAAHCGLCQGISCKDCSLFLEPDTFSFMEKIPEDLKHERYCRSCYDEKIAPELAAYSQAMERAKQIFVFYKNHEYLRVIRRSKKILKVGPCPDRKEALLRLAFFTAQQSHNALVDVELTPEKIRNFGYQKLIWSGSGFPADVEPEKPER